MEGVEKGVGFLGDSSLVAGMVVVGVSFLVWFLKWLHHWRLLRGQAMAGGGGGTTVIPPGSLGWPVIGEMIDFLWCFKFLRRPDHFITKRKSRYGDTGIYKTHLFGYPAIISCSPEMNKQVFACSNEDGSFSAGWPANQLLGASTVAIVDGALHKRIRKHLLDVFSNPNALSVQLAIAQPLFISALDEWSSKSKIVAWEETRTVTFRNICEVLVSFKSQELLDRMQKLYQGLMAGLRSMTINIPGTAFHHAIKCRTKLTAILLDEVRRRKAQRTQNNDFMQILMDSTDENGHALHEMEVVDNIVSLILGGYDSTSNVMTWGLYYLAKYPETFQKLKEEAVLLRRQKPPNDLLTNSDMKDMKYASRVADELIRLANVSPFIFRRVAKDNVVINGYKFPKNWKVLVWIRSIHIDSKYYENPLTFNPDRWDDFKPRVGTYSVFGGGSRYCPGNNFAKLQLMMFLHYACLKYKWELCNPEAGFSFLPHPKPSDGAQMMFYRAEA